MRLLKNKLLWRDSFFCTLLTLAVSGIFLVFFINLDVLNPFYKAFKDFSFTDIYYSTYDNTSVSKDIIIVNIKQSDRFTIAQAIDKVQQQEPKVIGLDIVFKDLKHPLVDSILKQSLNSNSNIVKAYYEEGDSIVGNNSYFKSYQDIEGFINVNLSGQNAVIRDFIGINDKDKPSFATQIALQAGQLEAKRLKQLKEQMPINYYGNKDNFLTFDIDELLELEAIPVLKDAIVIFGYLGTPSGNKYDIEDKHFTPLNKKYAGRSSPDMFGVVIHANIIKMLIDDTIITKIPRFFINSIALICCFITIFFGIQIGRAHV